MSTKAMLAREVMVSYEKSPIIGERALFKEALESMQKHRLGCVCITDKDRKLLGVLTAGDIYRMLLREQKPFAALFVDDAVQHSTRKPLTIAPDIPLIDAVRLMEQRQIWDLPVVEGDRLVGLLHLHPAVKALLGI